MDVSLVPNETKPTSRLTIKRRRSTKLSRKAKLAKLPFEGDRLSLEGVPKRLQFGSAILYKRVIFICCEKEESKIFLVTTVAGFRDFEKTVSWRCVTDGYSLQEGLVIMGIE